MWTIGKQGAAEQREPVGIDILVVLRDVHGFGVQGMLGINDPWVIAAYLLCIASSILCVVYGAMNWNRGDEAVEPADVRWVAHEKKAKEAEEA